LNLKQSIAPFVPTPFNVITKMFELADLKSGELLIDLGCGDGRIVNLAAKIGAKAIGIDLNAKLIDWAHRDSKVMGIDVNTSFIHGNLFDIDVSKADVVTMYLTTFRQ